MCRERTTTEISKACLTRNEEAPNSRRPPPPAVKAPGFGAVLGQGRSRAKITRERTFRRAPLRGGGGRGHSAGARRAPPPVWARVSCPSASPRRRPLPVSEALPSVRRSCRAASRSRWARGVGSRAPAFQPAPLQHVWRRLVPGGLSGRDRPVGRGSRRGGGREPGKVRPGPWSRNGGRGEGSDRRGRVGGGGSEPGRVPGRPAEGVVRAGRGIGAPGRRVALADLPEFRVGWGREMSWRGSGAEVEADSATACAMDRCVFSLLLQP